MKNDNYIGSQTQIANENLEEQNEQNTPLFDIFEPKEFISNEEKALWEKLVFDMERIMTN